MNTIDNCRHFIVCEGFNTPPLGAIKKALNPEANTLPKQHTQLLAAGYVVYFHDSCFEIVCDSYLYGIMDTSINEAIINKIKQK